MVFFVLQEQSVEEEEFYHNLDLKGGISMITKKKRIVCLFVFMLIFSLMFVNYTFSQQLAVKRQTDGTIKIESTSTKMQARISIMIYCRTINELLKEEKVTLNKLISENRYGELKDSVEIIEELQALKMKQCR